MKKESNPGPPKDIIKPKPPAAPPPRKKIINIGVCINCCKALVPKINHSKCGRKN